jgi:hypothetical protein
MAVGLQLVAVAVGCGKNNRQNCEITVVVV